MNLITKYMTANRCYLAGRTITIKGIMIHSTATRGVMAKDWFSRWNNASTEVCVHAFVDDKEVYQYLPWNHRAWHCGGDGNNYLISIEMCEPKDINDKEYFKKVWTNTIELCVMLCKKYNLTEKDIMGHCEGYQKGIASNHSDPHHWFPLHGKNMNTFREELKKALNPEQKVETQPATQKPSQIYRVRKAWADANSQIGAYTILQNAKNCVDKNKGYYVFDKQGNVVYPIVKTEAPKVETPKPQPKPQVDELSLKIAKAKEFVGNRCAELQTKLNKLGYNCGVVDNVFGIKTYNALLQFQKDKGLLVDGQVFTMTWSIL